MMRLRARSSRSPQPRPFYLSNPTTQPHFCANYFDPFPCFLTFLPTGWPHSPKTFQIFKYDQNWTESCPKLLHKHSRNGAKPSNNSSKLVQKWSRNNPRMVQKCSKKGPKRVQKPSKSGDADFFLSHLHRNIVPEIYTLAD